MCHFDDDHRRFCGNFRKSDAGLPKNYGRHLYSAAVKGAGPKAMRGNVPDGFQGEMCEGKIRAGGFCVLKSEAGHIWRL